MSLLEWFSGKSRREQKPVVETSTRGPAEIICPKCHARILDEPETLRCPFCNAVIRESPSARREQTTKQPQVPVCDVCSQLMVANGDGYLLSTQQVVTAPNYWNYVFAHPWSFIGTIDPDGRTLPTIVMQQAGQDSAWLVCGSCISFFVADREKARAIYQQWTVAGRKQGFPMPGGGAANRQNALAAAVAGWSKNFGSPPVGMGLQPSEATLSGLDKHNPFLAQLVRREAKRVFGANSTTSVPSIPATQPNQSANNSRVSPASPTSERVSALIAELKNGEDSKARLKAAIELSRNPSEPTTSALIQGLKDAAPEVRGCCAESLRMLRASTAVEALIEVLLTDKEHDPAYYATKALGTLRTPRAVIGMISALEQRKGDLSELCFQLGEVEARDAVKALMGAARDRQSVSSYARRHAVMALEKIGDPSAAEALRFALDDPDEGVRTRAQNALQALGSSEVSAGDCCEKCHGNFKGQHRWGLECGSGCTSKLPNDRGYDVSVRYCHNCAAIFKRCPQCGGELIASIL